MSVPVFGDPHRERPIDRPAAYSLLHTAEGFAVVRTREDRLFLPGGGIRPGESPEEAVVRELMEECRIRAECIRETCSAIQLFTSRDGKRCYRSPMSFWECAFLERLDGPGDHETIWLREIPDEGRFAHEAHAWALTTSTRSWGPDARAWPGPHADEAGEMPPSPRRASRLLVLDPENRVLLFRYEDAGRTWWATPGGGLEGDETFEEAAAREAAEELSVSGGTLWPLWRKTVEFTSRGQRIRQTQRFFLLRISRGDFVPPELVRDEHRREGILAVRWWSIAELEASSEDIYPEDLCARLHRLPPDLHQGARTEKPPDAPEEP